jgi:hypothetical protein
MNIKCCPRGTPKGHSKPSGGPPLTLTSVFISAHITKWVAENNCPTNIVSDPELINLLTTGRPNLKVPSPNTIRRDVKATYVKCHECIAKLLQDHPGHIHIVTDVWTSTNHRVFVIWTVHFDHEGCMLAFLLDFVEVPESHTGLALAKAFQKMLEGYGLEKKARHTHFWCFYLTYFLTDPQCDCQQHNSE